MIKTEIDDFAQTQINNNNNNREEHSIKKKRKRRCGEVISHRYNRKKCKEKQTIPPLVTTHTGLWKNTLWCLYRERSGKNFSKKTFMMEFIFIIKC